MAFHKNISPGGAWLAQCEERVTLDPGVVSSSPTLGVGPIQTSAYLQISRSHGGNLLPAAVSTGGPLWSAEGSRVMLSAQFWVLYSFRHEKQFFMSLKFLQQPSHL